MQLSILNKKILATSLLVSTSVFGNGIGDITEHKGSGGLTRTSGDSYITELGLGIEQLDHIETANGRMKIQFVDETKLSLT